MSSPYSAYMEWAKTRSSARFNLASSGLAAYPLAELEAGPDILELGDSYYGYAPLLERLARKAGVDPARVRQALLGGFAASRVLEVHGERLLKADYVPGFRARLYQKDLRIANETAAAHAVSIPATAVVTQLLNALIAAGKGELDYSALGTVLLKLSGVPEE